MTYLLAKYTLLFLLTAFLGFVLGYWFSRRNIEDVSESFEDLRRGNRRSDDAQWNRLWTELGGIPAAKETDLTNVYERLDGVVSSVSSLPKPEPINFAPVESRLDRLEKEIKAIPAPEKPAPVNFAPIESRFDRLEKEIKAIPVPEKPAPVNFAPVESRLDRLEKEIKAIPAPEKPAPLSFAPITGKLDGIEAAVRNFPKPEPQRAVDLKPVQNELSTLRREIKGIPAVETHAPVDLAPVSAQIRALEQRLNGIARPQTVDLKPVDQRLKAIEVELGRLGKRLTKPARPAARPATRPARVASEPRKATRTEPRILSAALYGKKDNLKLISGVGPKLERLLNRNGVFYFWQVASWNNRDIDIIDARLDAFKGRIGRDDWVSQAKGLRREPGAAQMPADA